jgi:hypothetical protein
MIKTVKTITTNRRKHKIWKNNLSGILSNTFKLSLMVEINLNLLVKQFLEDLLSLLRDIHSCYLELFC